jgi:hypothetical protein
MWPVLVEKFNFKFLSNDAGGEVQLIILFVPFHWDVLGVLGCIRKL